MRKKYLFVLGMPLCLLALSLAFAGCSNPAGGGDLSQRSFSVSGKFTKSGGAGSGDVEFDIKSDAFSGGLAVSAESYTVSGILKDGAITMWLTGSYDPVKGAWSVSAKSSLIIYTLDGSVDSNGNSLGVLATIAVKSGNEWVPYVFPITEQNVTIADAGATNGEDGVPALAQGWWRASGSNSSGNSWSGSVLLSSWKAKGTVTSTYQGVDIPNEVEYSIVEIASGSGAGPYTVYWASLEYVMTPENFAKAVSQCLYGNETSVTALTTVQMGQLLSGGGISGSPSIPWVGYDDATGIQVWCGFTEAQMDTFYAQNYWKKWAALKGIAKANKYGASRIEFDNAAAPSSFSITNLVKEGSPNIYNYTYSFGTLTELKAEAVNLVPEHDWVWPDGSGEPTDEGVAIITLTR
ncbi:MAG: hypothetical protein LBI67_11680 [Treponema sp.]|jgi:hypothetical protein|nr:hypothetical protein [Treponema sp.]